MFIGSMECAESVGAVGINDTQTAEQVKASEDLMDTTSQYGGLLDRSLRLLLSSFARAQRSIRISRGIPPEGRSLMALNAIETAASGSVHPIRVLHLGAGNLYGGIETLLVTLARFRGLCPGMEPQFALAFEGRLSNELSAAGATVHLLGGARSSRPWTVWRIRRKLQQLIRQEKFDVVICHGAWPMAMFGRTTANLGSKLVFWAHDALRGTHWLERWAALVRPDAVIVNSDFTSRSVPKLYLEARRTVIYYPISVAEQMAAMSQRDSMRRELSISDDTVVIVQVSRMEPWKGHVLHLQALAYLKNVPNWLCWMVGGPQRPQEQEYLRQLRELAVQSGIADRVRFLGQRSDVPRLLAAADIFCQPNRNPEPFGIVFIEALGAGLPIVATSMGGANEIVDGSCGMLAIPGDASDLAALLKSCIESEQLRKNLGRNGPERARALCEPATQLARIEDVLRSLVPNRSREFLVAGAKV